MKNSERFMWLNIAIGLFVATLWYIGVALIFVEEGMEFKSTLLIGGAAFFGSALGLFYGLRLLVRMAFTRMGHMRKDDRWLGLDISIGLFAAFLWSSGAALILGGNSAEYTLASFAGKPYLERRQLDVSSRYSSDCGRWREWDCDKSDPKCRNSATSTMT